MKALGFSCCAMLMVMFCGLAHPAYADNAFLLQLGTFDSEAEANQKWEDVKSKNADTLNGLNLHIAEVSLPPSNKTTYRTQAGPVNTREQATSLCNALQSHGVQCYVVETAMFGTGTSSDQPESIKAAAPAKVSKHAEVASEDDSAHADDPDYIPPPMDSGPVIISSNGTPLASAASPAELAEMPAAPAPRPAPAPAPAPANVSAAPQRQVADTSQDTPAPVQHARKPSYDIGTPATNNRYIPGREPHFLDAGPETNVASAPSAPAPTTQVVAATPEPAKESPGFFSRLFNFSSTPPTPPPAASEGVVGSVDVSEAVRVPLTGSDAAQRKKIVPVLPQMHGLGGSPAESTDKTLWAQISYFRDEEQALTFYRQFNAAYPQYSNNMRIRITRPFGTRGSAPRVSLRVGPFAGADDVRTICAAAARWNARCTVVRDIGASMAMNAAPAHAAARSEGKSAGAAMAQTHGQYWAQLGTYNSSAEAWDAWKELKATHRKIASHMRPSVSTPLSSSASSDVYRLRAGPYPTEEKANQLCNRLQESSADCLVVNEH